MIYMRQQSTKDGKGVGQADITAKLTGKKWNFLIGYVVLFNGIWSRDYAGRVAAVIYADLDPHALVDHTSIHHLDIRTMQHLVVHGCSCLSLSVPSMLRDSPQHILIV